MLLFLPPLLLLEPTTAAEGAAPEGAAAEAAAAEAAAVGAPAAAEAAAACPANYVNLDTVSLLSRETA